MNDVNLVVMSGVLSDDAERIAGNRREFVVLRVQIRREWQGKETAVFAKVKAFAEETVQAASGLRKGAAVLVTGRIAVEKVEDQKTGAKRYDTYVAAQGIEVMSEDAVVPVVEVPPQRQMRAYPPKNARVEPAGRPQYPPQVQGEPYYDESGYY